jgi:copper(I)-binding protein
LAALAGRRVALLGLAALACGVGADRGGPPEVLASHAAVPAPPAPTEASAFLTLHNRGGAPDTLLGVESPQAGGVMLHEMVGGRMEMVTAIPLPAGRRVRLVPGSYHLMLHELTGPLAVGDTVTLELRFARASPVVIRAPVLRYTEAVEAATAPVRQEE